MVLFSPICLIFSAILILPFMSTVTAPLIGASDCSSQLARGISTIVSFGTLPTCIFAEDLSSGEDATDHDQESILTRAHRLLTSVYEVLQERKKGNKLKPFRSPLPSPMPVSISAMEAICDDKDSVTTSDCLGLMTLSAFKSLVQAALQYRVSGEVCFTLMSKDWAATSIVTIAMQPMARKFLPSESKLSRSVLQIYENAKQLESKGRKYTMEGQYMGIYNESINDLLGNYSIEQNKKHEIRHGPGGKTMIIDIMTVVLTSPEKVTALLRK
ncbi:kinesin-like nuclear fusion protein, partial [Podila verticillata]